jgi:formate dehydrogenase major subunit
MDGVVLSRRAFLRRGGGAAVGTALGGLAALGADLGPARARMQALRIREAKVFPSVCPYCAVGCDTVVQVVGEGDERRIVNIEGDVRSPVNGGNLCPKGAAIYQLHVNPNRHDQVLYRAPRATSWEVIGLEEAMDMVAARVKQTRDETWEATATISNPDGSTTERILNRTMGIFSLGGATMDNEWNHLQQKLMRGLGVVAIENQARI